MLPPAINLSKIVIFADKSFLIFEKVGRLRKIFRGPHGGFARFVVWSTSIVLILMIFWPGNNVIRWVGARIEISRQEKQIREYNRQIRQMDERIRMLTSDRDTLEKFAREQFNFAEPGDDVYIIGD